MFFAFFVAGFALLLVAPTPALAQALVIDAGAPGEAGLQADAAAISPRPAPIATRPAGPRTYVVQPGDTLNTIAESLGVSPEILAAQNGIADPDQISAGQVLHVSSPAGSSLAGAVPALPAGSPFVRLQFWPWPPAQGQTMVVWWRAHQPVTPTLTFAGQSYPTAGDGRYGWALVPLPALMEPGPAPLALEAGEHTFTLSVPVAAGYFATDQVPASTSDPILGEAEQVRAETERMTALFATYTPSAWAPRVRFRSPLEGEHPHTSPYGTRRTYGDSASISYHAGEDYSAVPGTPVFVPAPGTVVLAEALFVRGNAVVIDHGQGVFTGYWHLQSLDVEAGQQVDVGQKLGEVGSTGLSTGAHLHWELRVHGMAVDPLQWLAD